LNGLGKYVFTCEQACSRVHAANPSDCNEISNLRDMTIWADWLGAVWGRKRFDQWGHLSPRSNVFVNIFLDHTEIIGWPIIERRRCGLFANTRTNSLSS
jgi:hypothetical protein